MSAPPRSLLGARARFYVPIILVLAGLLLARAPGAGIGFAAGCVVGIALVVQVMALGAGAARRALPPLLMRATLALGLLLVLTGVGLPLLTFANVLTEAGAFLATCAALALILLAIAGRAPTMRGEDARS